MEKQLNTVEQKPVSYTHLYTYVAGALGEEYPLLLAGRKPDGASPTFPDYDDIIARAGLGRFVRWIGYVDEADKPVLYRGAEAFVFPKIGRAHV